jgi:hypothetical protein
VLPWFLDVLGLDGTASEHDIKRAYAQRLKASDPETEAEAFAQLRSAYEAAREWSKKGGEGATPHERAMVRTSGKALSRTEVHAEVPATSRVFAAELVDDLSRALGADGDAHVAAELERLTATARQHHIEMAHLFEWTLIERLASSHLPARLAVYEAAFVHFGWSDVQHVQTLGDAGTWIDELELEKRAFLNLEWGVRKSLRDLFIHAGDDPSTLHEDVLRDWDRAWRYLQAYPRYLRLYVSEAVIQTWGERFEKEGLDLPRGPGAFRPRSATRRERSRRQPLGIGVWMLLAFIVIIIISASNSSAPWGPPPPVPVPVSSRVAKPSTPPAAAPAGPVDPEHCMAAVDRLIRSGADASEDDWNEASACRAANMLAAPAPAR